MIHFIIYNSDGEILREGAAPANMIEVQAGDGEYVIEGVGDPSTHKVVAGKIVPKTVSDQKTYLLSQREGTIPEISPNMSDEELNQVIEKYFLDMIDVSTWRIDNYSTLRTIFYPDSNEVLDASAKITSDDPTIVAEGAAQLAKYYADVLAVKARFPKE